MPNKEEKINPEKPEAPAQGPPPSASILTTVSSSTEISPQRIHDLISNLNTLTLGFQNHESRLVPLEDLMFDVEYLLKSSHRSLEDALLEIEGLKERIRKLERDLSAANEEMESINERVRAKPSLETQEEKKGFLHTWYEKTRKGGERSGTSR
ncbi:hypothetical protein MKZ38_002281 [Zalerion maritima]|uniref:Uncharacterized protein n=1 Tax=Zalerion maritima TaxID=339359 RepID=A0AAD5WLI9_9PEZI|nr:hypothetical protein MKZ38_002281 [Zalerion maritima]